MKTKQPPPPPKSARELERRAAMLKRGMRCACSRPGIKFDGASPVCERCSSLEAGSASKNKRCGAKQTVVEPYHVAL